MWTLMKYEFRKTWFTKVIFLVMTALAEIAYLAGLYGKNDDVMGTGILFLVLLTVGGILVIGLESVVTLYRDMNTKQAYMLFMTPHSDYAILGAKVLECTLSILLASAFFFALGTLDITLLFAREGQLNMIWKQIQQVLASVTVNGRPLEINLLSFACALLNLTGAWISTVTMAYLAVVIMAALLNGKKYNGVLSFLVFLALNIGVSRLVSAMTGGIQNTMTLMAAYGAIYCVLAGVMYFITAWIMEKKLSV